jgi:hypothetical protein
VQALKYTVGDCVIVNTTISARHYTGTVAPGFTGVVSGKPTSLLSSRVTMQRLIKLSKTTTYQLAPTGGYSCIFSPRKKRDESL